MCVCVCLCAGIQTFVKEPAVPFATIINFRHREICYYRPLLVVKALWGAVRSLGVLQCIHTFSLKLTPRARQCFRTRNALISILETACCISCIYIYIMRYVYNKHYTLYSLHYICATRTQSNLTIH